MSSSEGHAPSFDATLGPIFIGYTLSCCLFGLSMVQAYLYYRNFRDDSVYLKTMVGAVFFMELGHEICMANALYVMFVRLFGSPEVLARTPTGLDTGILFSSTLTLVVQGFFTFRVWKTINSLLIASVLWLLSALRFIGNVAVSIETFLMHDLETFSSQFRWLITAVWIIGAVVDVSVTACLCWGLYRRRKESIPRTALLIDRLILWTVETGLITSTTAVIMAICFLAMKTNLVWLGMYMFLPRFFANSLFASLNARSDLRAVNSKRSHISDFGDTANSRTLRNPSHNVRIEMTSAIHRDDSSNIDLDGKSNAV